MSSRVEMIDPELSNIGEVLGAGWMNLAQKGVKKHVCIDLGDDHVIAFFDKGEGTMVALWNLESASVVASVDIDRRILFRDLEEEDRDEVLQAIKRMVPGFMIEDPDSSPSIL